MIKSIGWLPIDLVLYSKVVWLLFENLLYEFKLVVSEKKDFEYQNKSTLIEFFER